METISSAFSSTTEAGATTPPSGRRIVLRIRLPPAWTPEEDACLERLARENGFRHWRRVAGEMPARRRSSRQCRDRWRDHLARDVYHRPFTPDDDAELARLRLRDGSDRWKDISRAVYCRSSRAMRRRWRELRKSDAFLRALYWRPHQPVQPPVRTRRRTTTSSTPAWLPTVVAATPWLPAARPLHQGSPAWPHKRCACIL